MAPIYRSKKIQIPNDASGDETLDANVVVQQNYQPSHDAKQMMRDRASYGSHPDDYNHEDTHRAPGDE